MNSSTVKVTLEAASLNSSRVKRLKNLMALLVKAQAFRDVSVRVVHHYTQHEWGLDFTFEALGCGKQGYMRGRGGSIQRGDHIVLQSESHVVRYQVEEIDYDAKPSDFWVALLHPCSELVADRRFWMQPVDKSCQSSG